MSELPFTGERFVPQVGGNIELEHMHRYLFACELVANKDVLDIACGEGYGTAKLAQLARFVHGVDISQEAVDHAILCYQLDNMKFIQGSCDAIPLLDNSIDVVVSFETIEHHDKHEEMMQEVKRVLRPGGLLIISSPDKMTYTIERKFNNPFHVKELYAREFKDLLGRYFNHSVHYGQKIVYGSAILPEDKNSPIKSYWDQDHQIFHNRGIYKPIYFISLASDIEVPPVHAGIYDRSEWTSEAVSELRGIIHVKEHKRAEQEQQTNNLRLSLVQQERHARNLQSVVASAEAWQRRSWFKRAFHRWRKDGKKEKVGLLRRWERSIRKRRKRIIGSKEKLTQRLNITHETQPQTSNITQGISWDNRALKPCHHDKVIIITTKHTLFVANLIHNFFEKIGRKSVVLGEGINDYSTDYLYIVICPQMFEYLPQEYVAFQMEQSINSRWFDKKYFDVLNKSIAILDHSKNNIDYLIKKEIRYQKIYHMPIGGFPRYKEFLEDSDFSINKNKKTIDVLFYGDANCPRRKKIIDALSLKFRIHIASEVFGNDILNLISQAKVVLNIHYYENALLESTRIFETLSLGVPIVSETSSDIEDYENIKNLVSFVSEGSVEDMATEIQRFLSNDKYYNDRVLEINDFILNDQSFNFYFARFLLAHDQITYKTYQNCASTNLPRFEEIPKLCLSLSETSQRQNEFKKINQYDFEIVEGLRHVIGWIGCGMSYKKMLNDFLKTPAELCVICEDDVSFCPDFDVKFRSTLKYLKSTEKAWHIFAGIIADVHPDTTVLDIEMHDGIEYIYIDKMTSMVFNVYTREIASLLCNWPEWDRHTDNTIDRYLQNQEDLIVVTTLPNLVGHTEDLHSTLWGGSNSIYNEMISNSEIKLRELITEYKKINLHPIS
jgi:SAM-dependent methyltransferase/GR25 family glycosyltransferase involved in LPS biosynthesis